MLDEGMEELLAEFLVESFENLDQLDQDLIALEQDPSNPETLGSIFRTIHTIKGTCGFLGFEQLERITHVGENLLAMLRDGELLVDAEIASALLALNDAVRAILVEIETTQAEGNGDYSELVETLTRLQHRGDASIDGAAGAPPLTEGSDRTGAAEPSLYEQLGGTDAIRAVVDGFYERVLADADLAPFFEGVNMKAQAGRLTKFVAAAAGGPPYRGRSMRDAHARLGIEQRHFDAVAGHLVAQMQAMGVPTHLVDAVVGAVAPLAEEIVQTTQPGAVPASVAASAAGGGAEPSAPRHANVFVFDANVSGTGRGDESGAASEVVRAGGDRIGEILVGKGEVSEVDVAVGLIQQEAEGPGHEPLGKILAAQGAVEPQAVDEALAEQREVRSSVADSSIRVDVGLLDKLMTLVGELVLARNQILQIAGGGETSDAVLGNAAQRLNMITTELQAGVMKTRMQPIGNVWSKFPRVVRDLAHQCNKLVRIEMEGKETELDKTIIEAIKDPLTHLVRNSVDHGIEPPEVRRAAGKPEEGVLTLRAYHEGGQVNIEIVDDGGGIDVEKLKAKAVEKGLVTADQAAAMGDREALHLIFLPGFSTAAKVTNVSGRGVGMDVVKTNIERIGGTLDVQSRLGEGTSLKIKIPLTLAIIPALVVSCGGDRYAIPQVSLLELVGLDAEEAKRSIESVHGHPVYRLRGKLLPLVHLDEQLGVESQRGADGKCNIVVLRADDREFGLVVDDVRDTEEIVVKPLSPQLKNLPIFSGCTIMGDGQVALILDVLGIAQRANVVSEVGDTAMGGGDLDETASSGDAETLLVLKVGRRGRTAVPLELVDRLEEFPVTAVEHTAGREVVQYRESIMPLVDVASVLGYEREYDTEADQLQVVVYQVNGHTVGLVVDRILDITEERLVVQQCADRLGIVGSAVVQGAVTDLLDIEQIIVSADPRFFDRAAASPVGA